MGVFPQRQHSPWWASTRTITSSRSIVTVEAFICQCVNCVNLPIFQSVLTFHFLLFWYLFMYLFFGHIPCCGGYHYSSVVSECWKCQWHAAAGVRSSQTTAQNWHIIGHITNLTSHLLWAKRNTLCVWVCVHVCVEWGGGEVGFPMIYSLAESKSIGGDLLDPFDLSLL